MGGGVGRQSFVQSLDGLAKGVLPHLAMSKWNVKVKFLRLDQPYPGEIYDQLHARK